MAKPIKKNMLLTFTSDMKNLEEEKDRIEFITNAEFFKQNNKYYVTFSDSEVAGNEPASKTTLKIEKERVTMLRYGSSNTQFIFEQGKKHTGQYETPYGAFSVGVFSDNLSVDIGDHGGSLNVSYGIYLNDLISQYNKLSIQLKEQI